MRMSIDKCLAAWLPFMRFALGPKDALEAQAIMRPIIEKAQAAEDEGRVYNMQPCMASCNPPDDIRAGQWRLEIRYQPIEDGNKLPPRSWITEILQPYEDHDEPAAQKAGSSVQG